MPGTPTKGATAGAPPGAVTTATTLAPATTVIQAVTTASPPAVITSSTTASMLIPSEEAMLKLLSSKYTFTPITPTSRPVKKPTVADVLGDLGARPKHAPSPLLMPQPLMSTPAHFAFADHTPTTPSPYFSTKPPKIPSFSGDEPIPKGEITYYEYRHEVQCLKRDQSLATSQVLQAIRTSLRGTARKLMVSLGDSISVDSILHKLEVNYGEPTRKSITMQEFFNAGQRVDESVTSYGCRLESILCQAFEKGHFSKTGRSELLCEKLWSGLRSSELKTNTRHKLDSATNYDQFLRDVRQVETELKLSQPQRPKTHAYTQQAGTSNDFQRQLQELDQKMQTQVRSLQSGIDKKLNALMQRLESISIPAIATPPHDFSIPPPQFPQPSYAEPFEPEDSSKRPGRRRGYGSQKQSYQGTFRAQKGYPNY